MSTLHEYSKSKTFFIALIYTCLAFDFLCIQQVDEDLQATNIPNCQLTSFLGQIEVTQWT